MALDPSISLQNQPNVPLITPQQLMGLKSALLQNQQAQLQIDSLQKAKAAQDAVNDELRTPGSADELGITPQGLQDLSAKGFGMEALKLRTERTKAQAQQTQLDYTLGLMKESDLRRVGEVAKIQGDAVTAAVNADIALPEGSTETARQDAGQKALDEYRDRLKASGANPKVLDSLPTKYDPPGFRRSQEGFDAVQKASDRLLAEKKKKLDLEHTEESIKNFKSEEKTREETEKIRERDEARKERLARQGLTGDATMDAAIHDNAVAWIETGKMPTGMGRGGQESMAIQRQASEIMKERGLKAEDLPRIRSRYAALNAAEKNLTGYSARVDVAIDSFHENIPVAIQGLKDLGNTNSKLLNMPINEVRRYITDPNLSAAVGALSTAGREYERAVVGASSNAQLPVAALEHAQQLVNPNMTVAEAIKLFSVLDKDTANVKKAIEHGVELNEWKMDTLIPPAKGEKAPPRPELDQPASLGAKGPAAFPGAKQIDGKWYFPLGNGKWSTTPPEMN